MFEIGTRVKGDNVVETALTNLDTPMRPGVVYQAMFQGQLPEYTGWESTLYRNLREELAAYGCDLFYFGVCPVNQLIIVQWKMAEQPGGDEYQSTSILGGVAVSTIVLAIVGVIGLGIGGFSIAKVTEVFQAEPELTGVIMGGAVLAAILLAAAYLIKS